MIKAAKAIIAAKAIGYTNLAPRRRIERPTYPLGGGRSIH